MRFSGWLGPVAVAVAVAIGAGPAAARPAHHGGGARVVPAHLIHGQTGGELLGEGFARFYGSQIDDPPEICPRLGRRGEILLMSPTAGTSTCTVKPGTPIFINGIGNACSDVDPEPVSGAAAQAACTLASTRDFVDEVHVSVDGAPAVDIHKHRFHILSPQMTVVLPEDNLFGLPAGTTATLVADAYAAAIHRLTPGRHRIVSEFVTSEGEAFATKMIVKVVPGA
jgi:hypothetical protein